MFPVQVWDSLMYAGILIAYECVSFVVYVFECWFCLAVVCDSNLGFAL